MLREPLRDLKRVATDTANGPKSYEFRGCGGGRMHSIETRPCVPVEFPVSRGSHCAPVCNSLQVASLGSLWDSEHPSPRKVTHLHDDSIALTPFLTVQKEVPANMNPMQERSLTIEDVPGPPEGPHILRLNGPL